MTYTLINGVNQLNKVSSGYKIEYKYGTTTNIDNFLEYKSTKNRPSIYFNNPLIFALFKSHFANEGGNSNIDAISQIKTSSENIVIKVGQFGSGAPTNDVSFGFVDKPPNGNQYNVIFLHSSLFDQFTGNGSDDVKKYALVLLEQYYNHIDNTGDKDKIKDRCATNVQRGGNPTKGSIHSSLKKTRKRKIPKK